MQRDCPQNGKQQAANTPTAAGNKAGSGTGVSSPVTGSQVPERAVAQEPAVSDGQDDWTVVKRRQKGKKQAGRQSEMLVGIAGPRRSPGRSYSRRRLRPSL